MSTGLAIALATSALAFAQAGSPAPAAAAPAAAAPAATAAPAPAYSDAQLLEEFGWYVAQKTGLSQLELTPAEAESLTKGITEAVVGKPSPFEIQKIGPAMSEYVEKKQNAILERLRSKNMSETTDFFQKLRANKNVVETRDGLRYEILSPGSGEKPKATDRVKVNYTGTLIDGTVFDSSERQGKAVDFDLRQMIPGWIEGLQLIGKGGKIRLYVPPQLAYGDRGNMGIPPDATLIFEVELVDFTPAPAPAAAGAAPAPAK